MRAHRLATTARAAEPPNEDPPPRSPVSVQEDFEAETSPLRLDLWRQGCTLGGAWGKFTAAHRLAGQPAAEPSDEDPPPSQPCFRTGEVRG